MVDECPTREHGHLAWEAKDVANLLRTDQRRTLVLAKESLERVIEVRRGVIIETVARLIDHQHDGAENQRARIMARGTMSSEALDSILARQLPDAEKRKRADFVVDTSHGLDPVRAQIRDILQQVARMPQRRS